MQTKNYELQGTDAQINFVRDLFTLSNPLSAFEPATGQAREMGEKEFASYVVSELALSATRQRDKSIDRSEFKAAAENYFSGLNLDEITRTLHREILDFHNCDCGAVLDNRGTQYTDAVIRLTLKSL
jgi:hypothetical protein